MSLGQNIKRLRWDAGLQTQKAFAEHLGVPPPQVSDWESDRFAVLEVLTIVKIAVAIVSDGRRRVHGGGDVSGSRLLGAHLPAVNPARRETVAGECRTEFAIDLRLPLPARCPDCGSDVLARADIEGPAAQGRLPFDAPRVRRVKRCR